MLTYSSLIQWEKTWKGKLITLGSWKIHAGAARPRCCDINTFCHIQGLVKSPWPPPDRAALISGLVHSHITQFPQIQGTICPAENSLLSCFHAKCPKQCCRRGVITWREIQKQLPPKQTIRTWPGFLVLHCFSSPLHLRAKKFRKFKPNNNIGKHIQFSSKVD